ncbi:hypothetical protein M8542_36625 [Amycolatopsis sp. OK19-0408]|uniref:Uncharacterized protein n=1 Tax=Amycolatopsis iheyensis TaxID=2945988 RepID=A0A9X2NNL1_9PSEU|nr:hypothetical protein [Amycolatopsis iheyensis]MCR6488370.1 hypothetical protein [Amycolatopsis iheyensis]
MSCRPTQVAVVIDAVEDDLGGEHQPRGVPAGANFVPGDGGRPRSGQLLYIGVGDVGIGFSEAELEQLQARADGR